MATAPPRPASLLEPGNIDLTNRPHVRNKDGSVSSVLSGSYNIDGREVLLPHVSDDGRIMDAKEAVDQYKRTGKHLGIFSTPEAADAESERLHREQEARLGPSGRAKAVKKLIREKED